MRFTVVILAIAVLYLVGSQPAQLWAEEATIHSISVRADSAGVETIEFSLNGTHIPNIFWIGGEKPRLVLDFMDTTYSGPPAVSVTDKELVKKIRTGRHQKPQLKTRIVVDLLTNEPISWIEDFIVHDNLLQITIQRKGTEQEEQEPKVIADSTKSTMSQPVEAETPAKSAISEISAEPSTDEDASASADASKDDIAPEISSKGKAQEAEFDADSLPVTMDIPLPQSVLVPEPQMAEKEAADSGAAEDSGPRLLAVNYEKPAGKGEMILFKLNDFYPPDVSAVEKGKPRIVCDFSNMVVASEVEKTLEVAGEFIIRVHISEQKQDKSLRAVIDLQPGNDYDLQQVFFKEENLFVLIINAMIGS